METLALRALALALFINLDEVNQGRPSDIEDRTIEDLEIKPSPDYSGEQVLTAYIDNHCPCEPFAVLTMDEAATSKIIPCRDYGEDDCVSINGTRFLIVYLG